MSEGVRYYSGLDLGQSADYTALAVAERTSAPNSERPGELLYSFTVRHLHRWPLGTGYPQVVADVKALVANPPLKGTTLALDRTGVGRAVSDLFGSSGITATVWPLTITGGERSVAKKDLVGAVLAPIQDGRLKLAEALPLTAVLAEELAAFRVKVTAAGNETFEAWRDRDHDDLVTALALALHAGGRGEWKVYL